MSSYSVCECGPCWYSPIEHHNDVARACISAESLSQIHPEQRFRVYDNDRQQFIDSGGVVFRTHRYQVYVKVDRHWCPMTRFNEMSGAVDWICNYDPEGTVQIKVKDNDEGRFIELDEVFSICKKPEPPETNDEWKEEGF